MPSRARLNDRLVAGLGGLLGILATGLICRALHLPAALPSLVAPMGASAVLVFAVPASPLAQPWAVIGGNTVSALVGVAAAQVTPEPAIAAGLAVGGAILAMSLLRCLHPPGGAAALTAVIGGPAVHAAGFRFALVPVGLDAVLLVLAGWLFHRFSGHGYPHRPSLAGVAAPGPGSRRITTDDLGAALADLDDTLDVTPGDIMLLIDRAEHHAAIRQARPRAGHAEPR